MLRATLVLVALVALGVAGAEAALPVVPTPGGQIPGYSATVMPCRITRADDSGTGRPGVVCEHDLLEKKTLRELAIMRNTIFARYGWDGFRKEWLRTYFHQQPWFHPNPAFSYRLLSDADRKNVHFIGVRESSLGGVELADRKESILERSAGRPLSAEDRIEIGLIDRALGEFATDDQRRGQAEKSLDGLLALADLRTLSLRDLRLLRNTIYARRGRTFKSPFLQGHFNGLSWYKADPGYSDALLSANDRRNIKLVRAVEDEFGGPIRDEDWLIEPAIDGA